MPTGPVASDTTIPPAPLNLSATATSASTVMLNWSNVPGETGFEILASTDGGATFNVIGTTAANILSFNATSLSPATNYTFIIRAVNVAGRAPSSGEATALTATLAPSNITPTPVSTSEIDLAWSASTGATGYTVQRSTDGLTFSTLGTSTTATYNDTTAISGIRYYYRLTATNAGGSSVASTVVNATPLATGALALTSKTSSSTTIDLTWNAKPSATSYVIQESVGGLPFADIATVAAPTTTYQVTGLSSSTPYTFQIIAIVSGVRTSPGNASTSTTVTAAPTSVAVTTNSASQLTVNWTPVLGATGYSIERSLTGTSDWSAAGATTVGITTFVDTTVAAGTTYYYRVVANNAGGSSADSTVANGTTLALAPGNLTATTQSASEIDLTWSPVIGAIGYVVLVSTDGTNYTQAGTTVAGVTTFNATSLLAGTDYTYKIEAVTAGGTSDAGSPIAAATLTASPTDLTATLNGTTANLTWAPVTGADTYTVERSTDGTTWTAIGSTTDTSLQNTNLTAGTTFYYRVYATNDAGNSTPSSVVNLLTTTVAPQSLTATSTSSSQITLHWNDVLGETSYLVQRSIDGNTWTTAGTAAANASTFTDTGLSASTQYSYRIVGVNPAGSSAPSNVASAMTAPAANYTGMTAVYGVTADGSIYSIDTTTTASTKIGQLAFGSAAAARDPITGKLYYIEQNTSTPRLTAWDPATGTSTVVATLNLPGNVTRAAFRQDGTLFLTAGNNALYTINATTGAVTAIGPIKLLGINIPTSDGDMAFSPNGNLYLATNTLLYTVNTTTAVATSLGTIGLGQMQIAFAQNGALYATSTSGSLFSLNLTTLLPTLLGATNTVNFTDLASAPLYANLGITQTVGNLVKGLLGSYTLTINNSGPAATTGPITVTDILPSGFTYSSATGSGWTFTTSGNIVTMTYTGSLASGASAPPITLNINAANTLIGVIIHTVSVTTTIFDSNTLNNTSALASVIL